MNFRVCFCCDRSLQSTFVGWAWILVIAIPGWALGQGDAKTPTSDKPRESIQALLKRQAADWNAGDIDGFMRGYWKSPELTFCSGGKMTRGWQKTLDGYKSRYPNREAMGKLTFNGLEITPLQESVALVLGKWHLDREGPNGPIGGNFTLVLQRINQEWVIIHDHTSLLNAEESSSG